MANRFSYLEQILLNVSRFFAYVGAAVLGFMVLFVTVDVIGRYIFNHPLKGDYELLVLAAGIVGSFGLAYCMITGGNIRIDIATSHFPQKIRGILNIIAYLFGSIFWALVSWRSTLFAMQYKETNRISGMLPIPIYPFAFLVTLGCTLICLVLLFKLAQSLAKEVKS